MRKVKVLISGSTGYIGIELVKILVKHKYVSIKYLCGNKSIGKNIFSYDKNLINKKLPIISKFNKKFLNNVDVVFTALPNGDAQKLSKNLLKKNILIDLSADFRLKNSKNYKKYYNTEHKAPNNIKKSIYALPEIVRNKIIKYKIISCPGCYPTSILLPLIPLIKNKLIKTNNIIIDSKSGYSGAGRGVHKKYINKNLYTTMSTYGLPLHRHNSEIEQELNIKGSNNIKFIFTPHLTPMFRGILSTIYVDIKKNIKISKIISCLKKNYLNDEFIKVAKPNELLSTNSVINTNYCKISVCKTKQKNKIIILSTLDNLIKGGSGQAVQNLNIFYGYNLNEGLK